MITKTALQTASQLSGTERELPVCRMEHQRNPRACGCQVPGSRAVDSRQVLQSTADGVVLDRRGHGPRKSLNRVWWELGPSR